MVHLKKVTRINIYIQGDRENQKLLARDLSGPSKLPVVLRLLYTAMHHGEVKDRDELSHEYKLKDHLKSMIRVDLHTNLLSIFQDQYNERHDIINTLARIRARKNFEPAEIIARDGATVAIRPSGSRLRKKKVSHSTVARRLLRSTGKLREAEMEEQGKGERSIDLMT
ncbi:hypothetical protein BJ508DRAFT_305551 [Ascobolus immersus RN42]|uniref:Uncharacterized protein n=1 Tax=Ascobolus immersus RN42 TaxID=1160509 RepID=A0A3N4I8K3_ASCIM|nr:hypothetical protein BJ508DRAFT_305551 [Ascobolus immersus RN42]